jgi:hypothetical protein
MLAQALTLAQARAHALTQAQARTLTLARSQAVRGVFDSRAGRV